MSSFAAASIALQTCGHARQTATRRAQGLISAAPVDSSVVRANTARRLSRLHVTVYRLTGGVLGRRLVDNNMLLLTTRGRTTGKAHTVPLLYLPDGDTLVVIASWGGRPRDPEWYRNLVAEPRATVQVRSRTWAVRGRTADTDERGTWWPRIVAAYPGYRIYQSRTDRTIPVVLLEPIPHHR
jgi:deazaflavin-dependent oxidoreductase (nitroreductase family)